VNIFAYARVSTLDQQTDSQIKGLMSAYPNAILRQEKKTGTTTRGRDVLNLILEMIGPGDKLVVWKLDRLARNVNDLCKIIETLNAKGSFLEIIDQKIDTGTATGRAFLQMLGVFAEFETNLRKERQLAGIAAAKAKGKHLGRPILLTKDQKWEIRGKKDAGEKLSSLSKEYAVSRGTIYNVLKETDI